MGLNQLNQVVVIATGYSSCDYIYDSSLTSSNHGTGNGMPALFSSLLEKLEDFVTKDEELSKEINVSKDRVASSLLSGSLSLALCYIQRVFRSGHLHPQPRVRVQSIFGQSKLDDVSSVSDKKRKSPDT